MRHSHRKRSQHDAEEEEVDDLAVAASFAVVTATEKDKPSASATRRVDSSSSSDDSSSESSSDSEQDEKEETVADGEKESGNGDLTSDGENDMCSDDDDESDVDLSEALARMHNDEDDGDEKKRGSNKGNGAPQTEHEVDAYKTPLSQLETNFHLNLSVKEQEQFRLADTSHSAAASIQLSKAGHVKCHMVEDRTVIVESNGAEHGLPLDEGTLLVVRIDDNPEVRLLPLGKTFEIFGPVRKPLYSIRLPVAPGKEKDNASKKAQTKKVREAPKGVDDKNEIILDGDDNDNDEPAEASEGGTVSLKDAADGTKHKQNPESSDKAENTEENRRSKQVEDPWSANGIYTTILSSRDKMTVYYIQDEATLIDTTAVMRGSGKGCDASNLYDEEVANAHDMYFSDDEAEREFKNRNKKGKKHGQAKGGRRKQPQEQHGHPRIPGFHPQPPSQPQPQQQYPSYQYPTQQQGYPYPAQYQYAQQEGGMLPPGSTYPYPTYPSAAPGYPAQPGMPPAQYPPAYYSYPQYSYPQGQQPQPPPQGQWQQGQPPNNGSNQNSDTVYYDYSQE